MLDLALLRIRRNWFLPLAVLLLVLVFLGSRSIGPIAVSGLELPLVFDALVTVPALFWMCYHDRMRAGALAIRVIGLQCLGLLLASWIVPIEQQHILPKLESARWIGLVLLAYFEAKLAWIVIRTVFAVDAKPKDLTDQGVPEIIAKLMLLEAHFWKWVVNRFRR